MRILTDTNAWKAAVYDKRGLQRCRCGRHYYPSKKMLVDFLKQYKDIRGTVKIWSLADGVQGENTITCTIVYKVGKLDGDEL